MVKIIKPKMSKVVTDNLIWFLLLSIFVLVAFAILYYVTKNIFILLIPFVLISLFIFIFIVNIGTARNTKYIIEDKRFNQETLFIVENRITIPISQVTNIDYSISWLMDKIFKTGTLKIYTAGSHGADLYIKDVRKVTKIYEDLNSLLKINKSLDINHHGEISSRIKNNEQSELLRRVKPNAFVATLIRVVSGIVSLGALLFYLIIIFIGERNMSSSFGLWAIGGILIFSLVSTIVGSVLVYISYKRKYYDFYNDKLEYYDGFLTLNKATIPLERITNIDERRGLIDRVFGTSSIGIETAGSGGAEVTISYVDNGASIVSYLKEVLKKHGRN